MADCVSNIQTASYSIREAIKGSAWHIHWVIRLKDLVVDECPYNN